jgi:hypothetical protein
VKLCSTLARPVLVTRAPVRDLGVAPDGSGECTPIQAAGDAVSANSTARCNFGAPRTLRRARGRAAGEASAHAAPHDPPGGSPAGAIRVRADRVVVRDGSIEGDVDGV